MGSEVDELYAGIARAMWKTLARLRRERDEWKALYDGLVDRVSEPDSWQSVYDRLVAERDEARARVMVHLNEQDRLEAVRDAARAWARRMRRERDEAVMFYDGLVNRVAELDDATADWRYENEKLRRALAKEIELREDARKWARLLFRLHRMALASLAESSVQNEELWSLLERDGRVRGEVLRVLERTLEQEAERENTLSDLMIAVSFLRHHLLRAGFGADRLDEMMGDPLVVIEVATQVVRDSFPRRFVDDIEECPRCGSSHTGVVFTRFDRRPELGESKIDCWASCPSTGDPVLMYWKERESEEFYDGLGAADV